MSGTVLHRLHQLLPGDQGVDTEKPPGHDGQWHRVDYRVLSGLSTPVRPVSGQRTVVVHERSIMTDSMNSADDVPAPDTAIVGRPDLQPDTQGDLPLEADLGEDGQGDLDGEGLHSGDAPDDLRSEGPSGPVDEEQGQGESGGDAA